MTHKIFQDGVVFSAADAQLLMNQGIPAVTLAERNAIPNPPDGMRIWRTDTRTLERRDGAFWTDLSTGMIAAQTSNSQSIPNGAFTTLVFTGVAPVTTALTSGSPRASIDLAQGIATITADGTYRITAFVTFNAAGAAVRALSINVNDSAQATANSINNTGALVTLTVSAVVQLKANDNVRAKAYQGSGAALLTGPAGGYVTQLHIERLAQ